MKNREYVFKTVFRASLLSFTFLFLYSCKKEFKVSSVDNSESAKIDSLHTLSDSINIAVKTDKPGLIFNIHQDKTIDAYALEFKNLISEDTIISRKIKRLPYPQVIVNLRFIPNIGNVRKMYLLEKNVSDLKFIHKDGELKILKGEGIYEVEDIYEDYLQINRRFQEIENNDYTPIKSILDSLYHHYQEEFKESSSGSLSNLNRLYYINTLQKLSYKTSENNDLAYSYDKELKSLNQNDLDQIIDDYLLHLKEPIADGALRSTMYMYAKHRLPGLNFDELLYDSNSNYTNWLALGVYTYLSDKQNSTDPRYENAFQWLQTTNFYKETVEMDVNGLQKIDNKLFAEALNAIDLINEDFKEIRFEDVVNKKQKKYYLLDFWATWCGPCTTEMKKLKTLNIPNKVEIISLSLDKPNAKNKWKKVSNKFDLKNSYLINTTKESQEFIQLMGINAIPRYILITEHLEIIDSHFDRPTFEEFIVKLKNLR